MTSSSISIPGRVVRATAGTTFDNFRDIDGALPADIAEHLACVLASPQFARARRDGPLLRFLVCASLMRGTARISEYAIAIDFYRRDPATYAPGEDPIVRVQMGRLRQRLAGYYLNDKARGCLRFVIPARAYLVEIRRMTDASMNIVPDSGAYRPPNATTGHL